MPRSVHAATLSCHLERLQATVTARVCGASHQLQVHCISPSVPEGSDAKAGWHLPEPLQVMLTGMAAGPEQCQAHASLDAALYLPKIVQRQQ
jgi:hypothetical protein